MSAYAPISEAARVAIERLEAKHGPGEAVVEDKGNGIVTIRYVTDPTKPSPPAWAPGEWPKHNPCAFNRAVSRMGRAAIETLAASHDLPQQVSGKPRVALCCTVLNEGSDFEGTVESLLSANVIPDKFSFVDDCSLVPIDERIDGLFGGPSRAVSLVRNKQRMGVGASRTIAHQSAGECDLYVFVDAHMRFPKRWLESLILWHRHYPDAVLCTASAGFENDEVVGRGCSFVADEGFVRGAWTPSPDGPCPLVQCVMGACYAISAKTLDRLGGFGPGMVGFGFDEEYLSLRAAACGIEVRCAANIVVRHNYCRKPVRDTRYTNEDAWTERQFNRRLAVRTVFPRHAEKIEAAMPTNPTLLSMIQNMRVPTLARTQSEEEVASQLGIQL